MRVTRSLGLAAGLLTLVHAIDLDINDPNSLLQASSTIVQDILRIYNSSEDFIPGLFPDDYYWWESGLAFDALLRYHSLAEDESVVQTIQDGLLWQSNAPKNDFMPPNQTKSLGNSDQAFWGLALMTAAETGFPQREDQTVSWLDLAVNIFDGVAARWDDTSCAGGFKWVIYSFNNGYNYKNAESQASFAQLAARLALFTGNTTYSDWAQKATQWSQDIGLISDSFDVYDGTDDTMNCSDVDRTQWTLNYGTFIGAAAYGSNATSSSFWSGLATPLVEQTVKTFTGDDNILYEANCDGTDNCMVDQLAFRAPLARALANARDLGNLNSTTTSVITTILQASARGAAAQCSGGDNSTTCGSDWKEADWDGTRGLGQDLSALEIIMANLPPRQLSTVNATDATATASENGTNTGSGPTETPTNGASGLVSFSSAGSLAIVVLVASLEVLL